MQELIKQSGMTIKEFSEFYEIPYNTVRQWANGTRKAPSWITKIINKAAKGTQININDIIYYAKIVFNNGVVEYTFDSAYEREQTKRTYENNYNFVRIEYKDLIRINA